MADDIMSKMANPAIQVMIKTYITKIDDMYKMLKVIMNNQQVMMDALTELKKKSMTEP